MKFSYSTSINVPYEILLLLHHNTKSYAGCNCWHDRLFIETFVKDRFGWSQAVGQEYSSKAQQRFHYILY